MANHPWLPRHLLEALEHSRRRAARTRRLLGDVTPWLLAANGIQVIRGAWTQALLFDALLSAHQEALDLLGEVLDERLSPSEALRVAARGHARFHAEHPAAITVVYKDIAFLSPEQYQRIVQLRHQYENTLTGIIEAGMQEGAFRVDDAPLAAIAILSMGIRVSAWFKPGGRLTADQIAEHYAEFALRMVGCTTDTRPDSSNRHDAAQVLGRAPGAVEAPGLPPES